MTTRATTQRVLARWRPTDRQRALISVAGVGLLTALALGRPAVVVLVAPVVGVLVAGWVRRPPRQVRIGWDIEPTRALEGDDIIVRVTVDPAVGRVGGTLPVAGMPARIHATTREGSAQWTVVSGRWGRWSIGPLRLRLTAPTGLVHADVLLPLPEITVYPATPRLELLPAADRLARQIGEHVAALTGHGGEFAQVRPLHPGDAARDINWAVSRRRQRLHVNQRFAEHAWDVVVAVDTFSDVGLPGRRSLDVAVRGAAAAAAGYLRRRDRVGLVVLGGLLRWLGPESAARQFYRIVDSILAMPRWDSVVDPDIDRVPRQALPPGALLVVFSPLLDERAVHVVTDLRERGFGVVVVDVLTGEPAVPARASGLTLRLWRLERIALRHELAELGVPVLAWDGTPPLDLVLGPLRHRTVTGTRSVGIRIGVRR